MPNWTYNTTSIWDESTITYTYTTDDYTQQMWAEHLEKERQETIKRKQIADDKRKYPLFFLKEGIV